jgi:hypothetical protein
LGGSAGSTREGVPSPMRPTTADTVESGIDRHHAISAAVIRSRRSAAIAFTRASGVRCGIEPGAEERSSSPASPSARYRATHFEHVRSLTSAASAAFASDHPCSITRRTIRRR